jgi:hypothetical protein
VKGNMSWAKVQQEKKRKAAIKAALLAAATEKIERLWCASMLPDSGFTPAERKAINAADHAIRSIKGGWLTKRIA